MSVFFLVRTIAWTAQLKCSPEGKPWHMCHDSRTKLRRHLMTRNEADQVSNSSYGSVVIRIMTDAAGLGLDRQDRGLR